jgi:hypothetical protein
MLLALRRVRGVLVLALLSLLLVTGLTHPVQAADFNVTTSPLPVLLSTTPGQSVSTTLRVQNSGTKPATFRVSLKKFKANGDSGKPVLLNRQPGDDYFDWVSFDRTVFEAQPQAWNEVKMTIKVPPDGAFGYYYAVVFSNANPTPAPSNTGSAVNGGTAILTLLDVKAPGEKKQLQVVSFNSDKKLYEYLPATFTATVRNTGNTHVSPAGNVFITRGKTTVATLDLNPSGGNVLPNSERTFITAWKDGFPVFETKRVNGQVVSGKDGKPIQQLSWNFSKANHLRFGHYTAHMLLTYDNGTADVPVEAQVSFWVVPWKMLPVIMLALILIGVGLWTSGRGIVRRIRKRWFVKT